MTAKRIFRELIPMGTPSEFKLPVPPANKRFTHSQMKKMVENYWEGPEKRAFIILHEWMKDLYNSSTVKEVALRVTDIEINSKIDAKWVSYPGDNNPTILNDLQQNPNVKYYILERKFYDDATPQGKYRLGRGKSDALSARIGKKGDNFFVFFVATKITYKNKSDGGIGNGGSGNAAQLPPPGQ